MYILPNLTQIFTIHLLIISAIDEAKGVIRRSVLLDIPNFDIVKDAPVEYMHGVCIGVSKKLVELTFNIGQKRDRKTKRKLSSVQDFNRLMLEIKVHRESSRRARALDFSVMKAQEYRNLVILYFPLVIECIEKSAKERRLWLLFAFMIRLCVIPSQEFNQNRQELVSYCSLNFYCLYEKLFGMGNCTYYTHVVGCHMTEMRAHGPLTLTSAFDFESFYGEMRNSFVAGTVSPLKQIMQNVLLKRTIGPHCCQSSIFYSSKETSMECNNLIYTFENNTYQCYKVNKVNENSFDCNAIGLFEKKFTETPTLNWSKVGVFKAGGIGNEKINILSSKVCGKIVRVQNLFITCPNNILREK